MIERGEVYIMDISCPATIVDPFPNIRRKYIITLQGGPRFANVPQASFLIISSAKSNSTTPYPYQVFLDQTDGFPKPSIADCRWVFTIPRSDILRENYFCKLNDSRMKEINLATARGLQLTP